MTLIKICGIKDHINLSAAITLSADFVGFVFVPSSPRFINFEQAATLARHVSAPSKIVGLFVNPDDELLHKITGHINLDYIQLHGEETPARTAHIKEKFQKPIIKAVGIATQDDLAPIKNYEAIADWILCDTKLPNGISGGSGITFDWNLLKNFKFDKPWMLSGGLTLDNVKAAIQTLNPDAVDVSSGVEISKGQKDPEKIRDFINKIR